MYLENIVYLHYKIVIEVQYRIVVPEDCFFHYFVSFSIKRGKALMQL